MEKLTESIRARVSKTEKDKLLEEVSKGDSNISEFIRNLVIEHFYEPTEEEIEQNIFIEKVKALRVLTGVSLDICRTVLIDVSGDSMKAMRELQRHRPKTQELLDKCPTQPCKLRLVFTSNGIHELSSYRGELKITDEEVQKTRRCTVSMVDIDFRAESSCGINYIEIISPIKASKRAIYDNIIAYMKNLMTLHRNKQLEIKPERKYFSPVIGLQSIEEALYDIIDFYEKNKTVKSEIIKDYMKKVDDLYDAIYEHRL